MRLVATRGRGLRAEQTPSLRQTRTGETHAVMTVVACCVVYFNVVKTVDPKSSHLKEKNCNYTK